VNDAEPSGLGGLFGDVLALPTDLIDGFEVEEVADGVAEAGEVVTLLGSLRLSTIPLATSANSASVKGAFPV